MSLTFLSPTSFYLQSASDVVTGDVTTASAVFTNLLRVNAGAALSVAMDTGPNFLLITFTCATSNNAAAWRNDFQVMVDGVAVPRSMRGATNIAAGDSAVAIRARVAVAAGNHTVTVQWKTPAGLAQIMAATLPDQENAILVVEEVSR